MISITDIARQVGVSPATVSRVINGKPYVDAEKKRQILQIVEETGYIPNKAARNMVLRRSFAVGVVAPDDFNMFRGQLFSIIERQLNTFGYHTYFYFVKQDEESEKSCLDRLKSENLDGIILLYEMHSPHFYRYLDQARLPAVSATCGGGAIGMDGGVIPAITLDDRRAAREAVGHLVGLGHRRIAMISSRGFSYGERRLEGYFDALEDAGLGGGESRIAEATRYNSQAGLETMEKLLCRSRDFTAIFAASDELAIGAMRALKEKGIRVPEEVSVIGFDDIDISDYFCPRLTTIRQPIAGIGEQSARQIHRLISGEEPARDIILPHTLIIRESTARPSSR
jgi:LacI family transcriptional regulator